MGFGDVLSRGAGLDNVYAPDLTPLPFSRHSLNAEQNPREALKQARASLRMAGLQLDQKNIGMPVIFIKGPSTD